MSVFVVFCVIMLQLPAVMASSPVSVWDSPADTSWYDDSVSGGYHYEATYYTVNIVGSDYTILEDISDLDSLKDGIQLEYGTVLTFEPTVSDTHFKISINDTSTSSVLCNSVTILDDTDIYVDHLCTISMENTENGQIEITAQDADPELPGLQIFKGSEIFIRALPNEDYSFLKWWDNSPSIERYFAVNGHTTILAYFTEGTLDEVLGGNLNYKTGNGYPFKVDKTNGYVYSSNEGVDNSVSYIETTLTGPKVLLLAGRYQAKT